MSIPRLYLVCGLPGAGKTTRSLALAAADSRAVRLCTDDWLDAMGISLVDYPPRFRFEPHLIRHAEQLLKAGTSVIAEFATWSRQERDAIRDAALRQGATVELHFVDAPLDVLVRRVRERGGPHAEVLAEEILVKLGHRFERPTPEETASYARYLGPDDAA